MKVVVAMDSFKGSLSAYEAGAQVQAGVEQGLAAFRPGAHTCVNLPLADGGEGLIDCLRPKLCAVGFKDVELSVHCAQLNAPQVTAHLLVRGHECIIESAQALGLPLIAPEARHIMTASSYGLGEMIAAALDMGCTDFKIGLGGSATNDLGLGMAQALGVTFSGASGLVDTVTSWQDFTALDDSALAARLQGCSVTILSDVTNPLLGDLGATAIFGRQKGASPDEQALLERALSAGNQLLAQHYGRDCSTIAGAGAAGGLGAALMYMLGATAASGIDTVLSLLDFETELHGADLVITGEGHFDLQTLGGKGPMGIARSAQAQGVPVIVLCGGHDIAVPKEQLYRNGVVACFSITSGPMTLAESVARAPELIKSAAFNVIGALCARQA